MFLTGFADEAARDIDGQIRAIKALGWRHLECRAVDGVNVTDIDDRTFDTVCGKLRDAAISINCFGSAIGNWAKKLTDPPRSSYAELRRAIPRMQRTGTRMIRVMSFAVPEDESINDPALEREVMIRMQTLAKMAEDGGVMLVHENCDTWGGRSLEHTLRLLETIPSPNLRLVFDTGNPVFRKDVRGKPPFGYQDAWKFYDNVKDSIAYVHIKDGRMENGSMVFTFAGDGHGRVREILGDLRSRGYDGGLSIEPHLAVTAHDPSRTSTESVMYDNFVEYGRRFQRLLDDIGWRAS
jgi:sugar phosphate isomerase/epimerase